MTLIFTHVSRHTAVQVSDRLVSRDCAPFDPVANKSLVVFPRNAVLTMAYTGAAYVDGLATDDWIAGTLIGDIEKVRSRQWTVALDHSLIPDLRSAAKLLRTSLQAAFDGGRVHPGSRARHFEVQFTGYEWTDDGRRWWPVLGNVCKAENSTVFEVDYLPSKHRWRASTAVAPPANMRLFDANAFRERSRRASPADAVPMFVDAIREASRREPGAIGSDCMVVQLQPPYAVVRVAYLPQNPANSEYRMSDPGFPISPGAYSPWIIGPGVLAGPSFLVGDFTVGVAGFQVELHAPPPPTPDQQPGNLKLQGFLTRYRRRREKD